MPLTLVQYAHGAHALGNVAPNLRNLAADALAAAKGHINFGPYDNDGNGYVDAFIVVHAGRGAEETGDANDIWSAKWVLPKEETVDGVKVYGFLTIPEDARLGVCAHELGHLLFGWPDLYDIDSSSEGVGNWCLMSGGSWGGSPPGAKPVHPSAWCKSTQNWVTVLEETKTRRIALGDVKTAKAELSMNSSKVAGERMNAPAVTVFVPRRAGRRAFRNVGLRESASVSWMVKRTRLITCDKAPIRRGAGPFGALGATAKEKKKKGKKGKT